MRNFATLSNLPKLPYPRTNKWNQVLAGTNHLCGYSNEAGVNSQVERVIVDILEAMGIRGNVTIRAEVEIMRTRPEFILIIVNGSPIGTIEGKQPGGWAMHHPNILGEVYDQLMHLHSVFRVDTPFAILTSYEEWRICWLEDTCEVAAATVLSTIDRYETPLKQKPDLAETSNEKELGKESSPPPPLTPSRKIGVCNLPTEDDDLDQGGDVLENENDDELRSFCGTSVISWDDKSLPVMLESVIWKMMKSRQGADPRVLRLSNESTSRWKKAPPRSSLKFGICIGRSVKNFYFWEDLGHGASGKAFLVSGGTKGAVGVLNFFWKNRQTMN